MHNPEVAQSPIGRPSSHHAEPYLVRQRGARNVWFAAAACVPVRLLSYIIVTSRLSTEMASASFQFTHPDFQHSEKARFLL